MRRTEELAPALRRTETEERLCALAHADLSALDRPAELGAETRRLVQIAALVALDGPLVSWVAQLDAADEADLDLDQILGLTHLRREQLGDVAHQVENLTEENALAMARQLADEAEFNFFRLGAVLSVIQLNKWYLPYDSFRLFVEGEFSIGYRTASYAVEL